MLEVQIPHDEEILKTPVLFLSSSLFLLLPFLLLWPDIAYLRGAKDLALAILSNSLTRAIFHPSGFAWLVVVSPTALRAQLSFHCCFCIGGKIAQTPSYRLLETHPMNNLGLLHDIRGYTRHIDVAQH
jgi:hypothetical protein